MKKLKTRNTILIIAILLLIGIAIGYAALSQPLTISGTASASGTWDVKITGITADVNNEENGATEGSAPTYTDTTATFNVNLEYPGATATYIVDIANNGSIGAVLESIEGIDVANAAEPTGITFSVTGVEEDESLAAGSTTEAIVTVTWAEDDATIPNITSKTATIVLNYVQE